MNLEEPKLLKKEAYFQYFYVYVEKANGTTIRRHYFSKKVTYLDSAQNFAIDTPRLQKTFYICPTLVGSNCAHDQRLTFLKQDDDVINRREVCI